MKYRTLAVALLLLLTGCGTNPPEPGPSETPAPSTSQSADPLYEEAVAVAKAIDEIDRKYYYQNKFDPFPIDEYDDFAAEDFLSSSKELYSRALDAGYKATDVSELNIRYRHLPGASFQNSDIAIQQCSDGANIKFKQGEEEKLGKKNQQTYFLKRIDGKLKVFSSVVDKSGECDF